MLKKLSLLAVCVVLMGLSGCLSSLTGGGKTFTADKVQEQIVRGKTTSAEVRDMYGEPVKITPFKGGEEWYYSEEPTREEKDDYRLANAAGGIAADYGANKAGSEVQKKHGAVAGTATRSASGAAGHAAVDAAVPADGPKAKTLIITFNKQGVVRSYRLK